MKVPERKRKRQSHWRQAIRRPIAVLRGGKKKDRRRTKEKRVRVWY